MAKLFYNNKAKEIKVKKEKKRKYSNLLGIPYYLILVFLIILPFFIMFLYAFSSTNSGIFEIKFTFNNFVVFFSEKSFITTMISSLYIAAVSTIATLLIGYPLAYVITKRTVKMQVLLLTLVTSPMWINMLIRANALKQITELFFPSLMSTNFIIVVGNVYMFLPFMVLPIYTILSKLDKSLLESSSDLGANGFQSFTKVILPLSLSGVVSGCMMVFLPAATTLVIPQVLGDGKVTMIGNLIEIAVFERHDYGYGAAISIIIGVILVGFIFVLKKVDKYSEVSDNE